MASNVINIGVIGCGQWGPNHIRIFSYLQGSKVLMCADPDEARRAAVKNTFPNIQTTTDYKDILKSEDIHAVCVVASTDLHYALTKEALECGKHVLCEKPLAMTPEECSKLNDLSRQKSKILMVGHVFLFNEGIIQLKSYIQSGELGKIHYAYSIRTNLGPFRYDVNALWDLAPHDVSIFNYLFDGSPVSVSGQGSKCLGSALEDMAFATLEYPDNVLANIHVSWLAPRKVRQMTVVGDKKMVVWDDLDQASPVKLYDKHVEKTNTFYETYGEFQLLSSEGSITAPKIKAREPLKTQGEYFLECITKNSSPQLSDASRGSDVVKTLCAIQSSIEQKGSPVDVLHMSLRGAKRRSNL